MSDPVLSGEKVKKAYSDPTWWYDIRGFFIVHLTYRTTLFPQIKFFEEHLSANHLEIAVGSGSLLRIILFFRRLRRKPVSNIIGIDYVGTMAESAKDKFKRFKNVTIEQGDASHLRFADNTFDSIGIANAFHCFAKPQESLKEIYRVLRPNGVLAVNVLLHPRDSSLANKISAAVNAWGQKKGILYRAYDADEVRDMFKAQGFTIAQDTMMGNMVNILAVKSQKAV